MLLANLPVIFLLYKPLQVVQEHRIEMRFEVNAVVRVLDFVGGEEG